MTGPAIAQALGLARSTVGLILRRLGLGRLSALEPKVPIVRYERSAPGEMIHLDIKKLGKFKVEGHRAIAWLARHGVAVQRVMTDNGSAYRSKLLAKAFQAAGARHVRTRPYTPRTNGKAERFIQTSLREWAYGRSYASSDERAQAISPWTDAYNLARPHSGIKGLTPWQRVNSLLGNDS